MPEEDSYREQVRRFAGAYTPCHEIVSFEGMSEETRQYAEDARLQRELDSRPKWLGDMENDVRMTKARMMQAFGPEIIKPSMTLLESVDWILGRFQQVEVALRERNTVYVLEKSI